MWTKDLNNGQRCPGTSSSAQKLNDLFSKHIAVGAFMAHRVKGSH